MRTFQRLKRWREFIEYTVMLTRAKGVHAVVSFLFKFIHSFIDDSLLGRIASVRLHSVLPVHMRPIDTEYRTLHVV